MHTEFEPFHLSESETLFLVNARTIAELETGEAETDTKLQEFDCGPFQPGEELYFTEQTDLIVRESDALKMDELKTGEQYTERAFCVNIECKTSIKFVPFEVPRCDRVSFDLREHIDCDGLPELKRASCDPHAHVYRNKHDLRAHFDRRDYDPHNERYIPSHIYDASDGYDPGVRYFDRGEPDINSGQGFDHEDFDPGIDYDQSDHDVGYDHHDDDPGDHDPGDNNEDDYVEDDHEDAAHDEDENYDDDNY